MWAEGQWEIPCGHSNLWRLQGGQRPPRGARNSFMWSYPETWEPQVQLQHVTTRSRRATLPVLWTTQTPNLTTTQLHPCKIDMEPNNEGLVQRGFIFSFWNRWFLDSIFNFPGCNHQAARHHPVKICLTNPNPTNEASQTILGFVKILGKVEGKEDPKRKCKKKQLNSVVSKMFFSKCLPPILRGKWFQKWPQRNQLPAWEPHRNLPWF